MGEIIIYGFALYKLVIIIIAILSVVFFANRVRKNMSTVPTLVLIIILWFIVGFFAFFPHVTDPIARIFGMKRGLDFFIILGLAVLFYIIFKLYIKVDNMNQQISELVRQLAIEKEQNEFLSKNHDDLSKSNTHDNDNNK